MELQTARKYIKTTEKMAEDLSEQSFDCDLLLPDYLPDIAAVLKCITQPVVQNHRLSGDRVMVEGLVKVQLMYLDEERKCVQTFETSQAFGCSFILKETDTIVCVDVNAKSGYTNCRAVSPRRVDIHGTFQVGLTVYGEQERSFLECPLESEYQTREEEVVYSSLVGCKNKVFTINETLELADTIEAHTLLRSSAVPYVTECKAIKNKAIIKGEVVIKNVYSVNEGTGQLGSAENRIPFSQIVDLEGLEEEDGCCCRATMLHYEAHPTQTPIGENKLITVAIKVNVSFYAFRKETVSVLLDLYHTEYLTKTTTLPTKFYCIGHVQNRLETISTSLETPNQDIAMFEDVWSEMESFAEQSDENGKILCIRATVCMLARDSQQCLSFYERPVEWMIPLNDSCDHTDWNIQILKTEMRSTANGYELQAIVAMESCPVFFKTISTVLEMEEEGATESRKRNNEAKDIKVYFAAKGESVWEIGKKSRVSISHICQENEVTADEILKEDTMMILVP